MAWTFCCNALGYEPERACEDARARCEDQEWGCRGRYLTPAIMRFTNGVSSTMTAPPITPYQKIFRNSAGSDSRCVASYWPVSCPARLLQSASDRNHTPITWPTKRGGASLVMYDSPTTERHSSAKLRTRHVSANAVGNTDPPASTYFEAKYTTTDPRRRRLR